VVAEVLAAAEDLWRQQWTARIVNYFPLDSIFKVLVSSPHGGASFLIAIRAGDKAMDGAEGVGRSPARKLAKATDAGDAQQGVGNAAAGAAARLTVADLFRKPRDSMGGAGGH